MVADNDIAKYNEIIKMQIVDFWQFYLRFKEQKEREATNLKNKS